MNPSLKRQSIISSPECNFCNKNISEIQFESEYNAKLSTPASSIHSLPFFPDKIPLNLNGCPVKIITGVWPPNVINISSVDDAGIEMEFIKTMEHQLNCNLSVHADDGLEMGLKFCENEDLTRRMRLLKVYAFYMNIPSTKSYTFPLNYNLE